MFRLSSRVHLVCGTKFFASAAGPMPTSCRGLSNQRASAPARRLRIIQASPQSAFNGISGGVSQQSSGQRTLPSPCRSFTWVRWLHQTPSGRGEAKRPATLHSFYTLEISNLLKAAIFAIPITSAHCAFPFPYSASKSIWRTQCLINNG